MSDPSIQALSAMGRSMQFTADNLANVNTDGFQARRVRLEDGPAGWGVRVGSVETDASPGPSVQSAVPGAGYVQGSNTDVAREMVDMITTQRGYQANAAMVRTWDQTMGLIVNLKV